MPDLLVLLVYLLVGAGAGVIAGLLGVGGGVVIVPALLWVFALQGVSETLITQLAVGTSLASIVITSLSSIRAHQGHGAIDWPVMRRLSTGIVPGAWLGAAVAAAISSEQLLRVFAVFIILVGLQMAWGHRPKAHRGLPGRLGMTLSGLVIGTVSAVVGIGGGSLTVPFLSWCGMAIRRAVATSAACGLPIAIAGSLGFLVAGWHHPDLPPWSTGFIYWPALLGLVTASFLTAPLGARLAHTLPVATLKRVFALLLLVLGIKMLFA